jgi:hypothetical protein
MNITPCESSYDFLLCKLNILFSFLDLIYFIAVSLCLIDSLRSLMLDYVVLSYWPTNLCFCSRSDFFAFCYVIAFSTFFL